MEVLKVRYGSPEAPLQFCESLKNTGFAVLTHHPIPADLIRDVFNDWEQFFASESKFQYKFDPATQDGYFPFKTENAKDSKLKDLKEFYHLHNGNTLPAGMHPRTLEYFKRVTDLATELLGWVQDGTPAAIREKFSMPLTQMCVNSRETLLRPIHYPPLKGDEEEGAIRAAAHEDINLITLLPAATAPGLQVKDTAGRWHDVPCDVGSFAINAGDMLQMASQYYYKSTTHQVVNPHDPANAGKARYSMPLFLHPRPDVLLSETQTSGAYLQERLREIGLLKEKKTT